MDVSALQQMRSRFRQQWEDMQQQVNSVTVEASAGGGMVTVKMNGQKQLVSLRIEPQAGLVVVTLPPRAGQVHLVFETSGCRSR